MLRLTDNPRAAVFEVTAVDESGRERTSSIAGEHALTLYLDKRELVTLMTLGAAPEHLVLGYLRNQRIVGSVSDLAEIQIDWTTGSAAVTSRSLAEHGIACWEQSGLAGRKLSRTVTTGCGQGTMYDDVMTDIDSIVLESNARIGQDALYGLLDQLRRHESVYKVAGAVHGCALCALPAMGSESGSESGSVSTRGTARVLKFVEDVGRHNAVDAIAGWMWVEGVNGDDKVFYTTGRLTSEMVIKCAQMRIPILLSRSGLTQMGLELARKLNMTLLGRCQGRHFLVYNGRERIVFTPQQSSVASFSPGGVPVSE